ncbi:MAG: DUF58 domain-containing protein [Actinomycetota bacterium]|nr:DUF58 domain-containing protein [Actinomycetota bacterium]
MSRLRALGRRFVLAECFAGLAGLAWALSSDTLALCGFIGALVTLALQAWQHFALSGLSYTRTLSASRVHFGEPVELEIEIVNDKALPLAFVEIDDTLPRHVAIDGAAITQHFGSPPRLVQVLGLLPYQRVRRRLILTCARRGEHRLGPATLTSGDPLGVRLRHTTVPASERLLVYPKCFALAPSGIASRVLVGDHKSANLLAPDPIRVAGVRPWQPGDPLRQVNWRATARTGALVVRRFEPSAQVKVAIFLDVFLSGVSAFAPESDELELLIALCASLVGELDATGIPVGCYSTGSAGGRPLALAPRRFGAAEVLEGLARLVPLYSLSFEALLAQASARLSPATSLVVLTTELSAPALGEIAALRRRFSVSAVQLVLPDHPRLFAGGFDALLSTPYLEDWREREALELAR